MRQEDQKLQASLASWVATAPQPLEPHPEIEALLAFRTGELPTAAARTIEDHLLLCRDCQDLLLAAESFDRLDAPTGDEPSELAVAAAWSGFKTASSGNATTTSRARPRRLLAVAAMLAVAVIGLSTWTASLHRSLTRFSAPQPDAPVFDLATNSQMRGTGDEPMHIPVPAQSLWLTLILTPPESPIKRYELRIRAAGQAEWQSMSLEKNTAGSLTVALSRSTLPDGTHQLELRRHGDSRLLGQLTVQVETVEAAAVESEGTER